MLTKHLLLLLPLFLNPEAHAFVNPRIASTPSPTILFAGFGAATKGGGSKKKGKGSKKTGGIPTPLKPKRQWDHYTGKLKKETRVPVGVRIADDGDGEWFRVGHVKSVGGEYTAYAVLRQRALLAEHAKRLFPVKMKANAKLEWGYFEYGEDNNEDGSPVEWTVLDTKEFDSLASPKNAEKEIGFEGYCDKASGYYCNYHEGKLVGESVEASNSKYA